MSQTTIVPTHQVRRAWDVQSRPNPLYALIVVDGSEVPRLSSGAQGGKEGGRKVVVYAFTPSPRRIDLSEPAASAVTPTQDGGVFVESQGQLVKDLRIEGTTGFRPNQKLLADNPGVFGVLANARRVAGAFADLTHYGNAKQRIPDDEETGAESHTRLRNLFRTYWDAKRDPSRAAKTVMIWGNLKEHEAYIVEPTLFESGRDASSPFTYTYRIQAKTLISLQHALRVPTDYLTAYITASDQNFLSEWMNYAAKIDRALTASFNLVTETMGTARAQFAAAVRSSLLRPVSTLLGGIRNVLQEGERVVTLPSSLEADVRELTEQARAVRQATSNFPASDAFGNSLKKLWWQGIVPAAVGIRDMFSAVGTDEKMKLQARRYRDPFRPEGDESATLLNRSSYPPSDAGSKTTLGSVRVGLATAEDVVRGRETIFDAAMRLLGNRALWKVLAAHNGLRAPYISTDGDGVKVLRPGDAIQYPLLNRRQDDEAGNMVLSRGHTAEERMGVDLAMDETLNDYVVDARGDLGAVGGYENLVQAVRVKFFTEQGELALHPWFGIALPIGERLRGPEALSLFIFSARLTLLSDPRIDEASGVDVAVVGDVARVRGDIRVVGSDDAVKFDRPIGRRA